MFQWCEYCLHPVGVKKDGSVFHKVGGLQLFTRCKVGCDCERPKLKEGAIPPKDESLGILAHDL